jgi:putative MATE family efflux protein
MPDEIDNGSEERLPEEATITEDFEPVHAVGTPVTPETTHRNGVDLTQGSLLRGIVMLSWPIVLGAFLNWIMGVADIKMVGSLGPEAIAAVGQSQGIIWVIMAIIFAIATGTQVLSARYKGAQRPDRVAEVTRQSIILSVIAGVVLIPIGRWLAPIVLTHLGVSATVLDLGTAYSEAYFWGGVGLMVNFMIAAALQGAGDTITPMLMLVWINIVHIVLEYMMIFGFGPLPAMGVAGAAWAVFASRGLAALAMIYIVTSGRFAITVPLRHSWRIDWAIWEKMFYIGMPSSLQGLVRNVSYLALAAILNHTAAKDYAISGHTAAGQWGALGVFVGLAMMTAAMTAVGQNMGANNPERAERSCWSVVWISVASSAFLGALCVVFGRHLIGFFTTDPQSLYWGWWALLMLSVSLPFATVSMAFSGGLRGAGDTWSPLWATLACTLVLGPAISYYLALVVKMGPVGAWLGLGLSMVAQALFTGVIFARGKWKNIVI